MSTKAITTLSDVIERYRHFPLAQLRDNEEFTQAMTGTGVNRGSFISRRFNFNRPTIDLVVSEDKSAVQINMRYGISGKTTLAVVDRNITILNESNCATIYIQNKNDLLSTLEDNIDDLVGCQGYRFPEDIRYRPISTWLDEGKNKYSFKLNVIVDTLTSYAELEISVVLDYIDLRDCTDAICDHLLKQGIIQDDIRHAIYHIKTDESETDLALRFKQHIGAQPILKAKGQS